MIKQGDLRRRTPNSSLAHKFKDIDNRTSVYGSKISDFKVLSELGRGSYGVVYKV